MIKKLGACLLCVVCLMMPMTLPAAQHEIFVPGLTFEYELPPNAPQVFTNVFFWTVKGNCTMLSEEENTLIQVKALRKTGSINHIDLSEGDSVLFNVKNGDVFYIVAHSGAQVELTNQGQKTIIARCSSA